MKLYEISEEQEAIVMAMIAIANNNEISEQEREIQLEELQKKLNQLAGRKEDKILNIARIVKNELAEAEAIGTEIRNLEKRKKSCESKAKWLKNYIQQNLPIGQELKDANTRISWRKSTILEIEPGAEEKLPQEYVSWLPKADKLAVKRDIQAGKEIPYCRIVERQNLQIK